MRLCKLDARWFRSRVRHILEAPEINGFGAGEGSSAMKTDYTYVLARVFGPLLAIGGLLLITQTARMRQAMVGFVMDDALAMFTGFATLGIGLLIVAAHQKWNSVTASLVTLIGWVMTLRGAVLLLAPELIRTALHEIDSRPMIFPIAGCAVALLGVWLTYSGYVAGTLRVDTDR
jgi:hypothetical protein